MEEVLDALRGALAADGVTVAWERPGVLAIGGALPSLAAKKRAIGRAAAIAGAVTLLDGLTVQPERALDDGAIREDLRDALLEDELFRRCALREIGADGRPLPLLEPPEAPGDVTYAVVDGIVTLSGTAADITIKRLASAMVWWVPGVRDVVNAIEAPDDGGEGVAEAVRLVLGRDPFLAGDRIAVAVVEGSVTLSGTVATPEERTLAEDDAWSVWDVAEVVNRITVARP